MAATQSHRSSQPCRGWPARYPRRGVAVIQPATPAPWSSDPAGQSGCPTSCRCNAPGMGGSIIWHAESASNLGCHHGFNALLSHRTRRDRGRRTPSQTPCRHLRIGQRSRYSYMVPHSKTQVCTHMPTEPSRTRSSNSRRRWADHRASSHARQGRLTCRAASRTRHTTPVAMATGHDCNLLTHFKA